MHLSVLDTLRASTPSTTTTLAIGSGPAAIWTALGTVIDPELGRDVVTLGLVYDVTLAAGVARVTHSLTSPRCPLGSVMQEGMRAAVGALPGVRAVEVRLVWDPEWHAGMIAADAWSTVP
jgi:metal-sulfur cluster biosynthetic enzyme